MERMPTTNVNIDTEEKIGTNVIGGRELEMYDIKFSKSEINKGISHLKLNKLDRAGNIKLLIDGEPVKIHPDIMKEFAKFFQIKHDLPKEFDCRSFVNILNSFSYNMKDMTNTYEISLLTDLNNLKPGEMIFLNKKESSNAWEPDHYAMYIGKGIFLSTSGPGNGTLIASTMDSMKHAFNSNYAYLLSLKGRWKREDFG